MKLSQGLRNESEKRDVVESEKRDVDFDSLLQSILKPDEEKVSNNDLN